MEQVLDLHLEDFVSSEILNVLQDPKNDSAPLDQQSLAATSNSGPSKETSERFGTISKEEIHDAIEKRVPANTKKSTGCGVTRCGWNGAKLETLMKTFLLWMKQKLTN